MGLRRVLVARGARRNVYLDALRLEQRYADVDWLLVVDTDMCQLWDFAEVARVTAEVAPHVQVRGGVAWGSDEE